MQKNVIKKTLFLLAILTLFSFLSQNLFAQETDSIPSDSTETEVKKERKRFKLFKFRKDSLNLQTDSLTSDSLASDSAAVDSTQNKKKFKLFKKKDKKAKKAKAPEKPSKREWREMTLDDKEKYFKDCHEFDSAQISEEIYSGQEKKVFEKATKIYDERMAGKPESDTLSRTEVDVLKTIGRKDARLHYMLSENDYKRRKTMFKYEKKVEGQVDSLLSKEEKMKFLKERTEYENKKEALRKQKVLRKYAKKEEQLYKKYELTENEKKALAKGTNMRLRGAELADYERAQQKQIKLSEKIQKLRRERAYAIQDDPTRARIDEHREKNKKRDTHVNKERDDKQMRKQEKDTKKRIEKNKRKT